jgi:hypothetical protein
MEKLGLELMHAFLCLPPFGDVEHGPSHTHRFAGLVEYDLPLLMDDTFLMIRLEDAMVDAVRGLLHESLVNSLLEPLSVLGMDKL